MFLNKRQKKSAQKLDGLPSPDAQLLQASGHPPSMDVDGKKRKVPKVREPLRALYIGTRYNIDPSAASVEAYLKRWFDYGATFVEGQLEMCPTTKKPHIQWFMSFPQPGKRFKTLCNFEPLADFTVVDEDNGASNYGGKEKTRIWGPWSFGKRPMQRNKKQDWDQVWENAKTGKIEDIPADIRVRCYNQIKRIEKDHMRVNGQHTDVKGVWIHGKPRVGKSTLARDLICLKPFYLKPREHWFDGYQGEPYILKEEMGKYDVALGDQLKIWLDRFHFPGAVKNSFVPVTAEAIYITSNYSIEAIWSDEMTAWAITERCVVLHLTAPYHTPLKKNPQASPEERYQAARLYLSTYFSGVVGKTWVDGVLQGEEVPQTPQQEELKE